MNKKLLVTQSTLPSLEEYVDEIRTIWDTKWLTNMGEKHQELQTRLEKYLGVEHLELLTNGHMALELSMQALNLEGEVITTPFTFASTTHAIVRNGLQPVFCDINENDFTIDVTQIENLITERTCAIVPVHVYGNVCDVYEIEKIAKRHNLKVIYDAAHTFGEKYKGRGIGTFGDVSCFSFHATKVFNTIEGGAVCFCDEHIGEQIYQLKNFGIRDSETVVGVGANAKMNEFCAAMGLCNLRHIEDEIEKRRQVVMRYRSNLSDCIGIKLNTIQKDVESNYAYFPIVINPDLFGFDRNVVFEKLAEKGIHARKYFYPITNMYDCYRDLFDACDTPIARTISNQVLTLPLYSNLKLNEVDYICEAIQQIGKKK